MKTTHSWAGTTANLLILLTPALIGPIAIAEGFADVTKPIAVEIDKAVLRIDIRAALRAVRENLDGARIVPPGPGDLPATDVKLAVSTPPNRG